MKEENNAGISKRVLEQWTSRCQKRKKRKKYGTDSEYHVSLD